MLVPNRQSLDNDEGSLLLSYKHSDNRFHTSDLQSNLLETMYLGYLVGDSLTWADLYLAEFAEFAKKVPSYYEGFPEVILYPFLIRP